MSRHLKTIVGWVFGLFGLALVLFWLVFSSSFFRDFRNTLVETALSKEIGQPLVVTDNVSVRLGRNARIHVSGVEIPSEHIKGLNLAELKLLELDVDLVSVIWGRLKIDNLSVDGLLVNLITQSDGVTSWTPENVVNYNAEDGSEQVKTNEQTKNSDGGFLEFLNDKTASFTDIGLKIDNQDSGFSFDSDLSSLLLEQLENGQLVSLTSNGTVNGETFSIAGNFPRGAAFVTKANFGQLQLNFDGQPLKSEQGGGFSGTLKVDTGEIGEVLDILRLDRVIEGRGHLSADLLRQSGIFEIKNFITEIAFDDGASFNLAGEVDNLVNKEGFDVRLDMRLFPENNPPARATDLKSLRLTGITAHIVSENSALKFDELLFLTNAFDQAINQVGPVKIGDIRRTEDGHLSLLDITLQMGPSEAPFLVAKGGLSDALQLNGLDVSGRLRAPASLVLRDLPNDKTEAFGSLNAEFAMTDAAGHLSLTNLDAYTEGTDLWSLSVHSAVPNVTSVQDLAFDLDLDVADGADFLTALDLNPVDVGALEFTLSASGQEEKFSTAVSFTVGDSRLDVAFDTIVKGIHSVVRGAIKSERLRIEDLQKGAASALEIVSLSKTADERNKAAGDGSVAGDDGKPEEALVLGSGDKDKANADVAVDNKPEEPLVLDPTKDKPTDLVNGPGMLANLDLEIGIEIDEITGQRGATKVSSDLEIKEAKARFGPLAFSYGGGYFSLSAAMDLIESPEFLTISGATSGWDLGEIVETIGVDIDAKGKLQAQFNVTGNRKTAKAFVNSLYGSATASMSNGAIATSLLELAGLGVFPWLFSAELNQGYTNIVCAVAPVKIQAGKISSSSIVLETNSVQMVVVGALDWKNDSISVRAEPRPVGRPLARSAWPFSVTGSLSKPDFKLDVGGSRVKRADGAIQSPANRMPCVPDIRQLE